MSKLLRVLVESAESGIVARAMPAVTEQTQAAVKLIHDAVAPAVSKLSKGTEKIEPLSRQMYSGELPTLLETYAIRNPLKARGDLTRMFGQEFSDVTRSRADVPAISTGAMREAGIRGTFRHRFDDVYFSSPDAFNSGSAFFVKLQNGSPWRLQINNDEAGLFQDVMSRSGFRGLSQSLPRGDADLLAERFLGLSRHSEANQELRNLRMTGTRTEPAIWPDKLIGTSVEQGEFSIARIRKPLATCSLNTCVGLNVVDAKRGVHYLGHVDGTATVKRIGESLKDFELAKSDIRIMEGLTPSGSTLEIITALRQTEGALNNVKFVNWHGQGMFPGLTSDRGRIYTEPLNIDIWKRDPASQLYKFGER